MTDNLNRTNYSARALDREKSTHFALGLSAVQRTFAVKFHVETGSNPITHQASSAGRCM